MSKKKSDEAMAARIAGSGEAEKELPGEKLAREIAELKAAWQVAHDAALAADGTEAEEKLSMEARALWVAWQEKRVENIQSLADDDRRRHEVFDLLERSEELERLKATPDPIAEFDKKLAALEEPFGDEDLEWRVQRLFWWNEKLGAVVVPYVTNRAIMHRLDTVLGRSGWKNEFTQGPQGGVLCGISVRFPEPVVVKEETVGEVRERYERHEFRWITKWDGADNTHIESVKGGLSDAMKRAAVQWGIGRHLYNLPEAFAKPDPYGEKYASGEVKVGGQKVWKDMNWDPPTLAEVYAVDAKRRQKRLDRRHGTDAA